MPKSKPETSRTVSLKAARYVERYWDIMHQPVKGSMINRRYGMALRKVGMDLEALLGHPYWRQRVFTHGTKTGGWVFLPLKSWQALDEASKAIMSYQLDVYTQPQPRPRVAGRTSFYKPPIPPVRPFKKKTELS